jgi:hypothetical protein
MPNEIYHKSNWGNANAGEFGDVYFDAAATNKLYNHSDYYENSNGTDKILRDLSNKASIVLTPTAYSDGSLNTVIPPYQVLPQELVTNGDFSNGTTNWTLDDASNGSISVVDGKLEIVSNGGAGYPVVKQGISTSIGKKYSVTFSVTNNTTGFWFRVDSSESGLGGFETFYANDKTSSINFKGEFTAISTTSYLKIFAEQNDAGSFEIDNISIKEIQEADFDFTRGSSATRVNEQGLIESIASGLPRIDYTSGFGSLLLEPQRTNLITYSEDFSQSVWSTWQSTKTLSNNINPKGINGYYEISHTGSSSNNPNTRLTNVSLNGSYTLSFFVKINQSRYISLSIADYDGDRASVYFDTINKTFTTISNVGSPITNTSYSEFSNDWIRISLSVNLLNAVYNEVGIGIYNPSGSFPSASGEVISVFGSQLEAGSYATSYIPTNGSTVTRSADVANNSGNADLINSIEGVLYAEIEGFISTDTVEQNRYITLTNGTSNQRVALLLGGNTNQLRAIVYSNTQGINLSFTTSLTDVKQFNKLAVKYKSGDYAFFLNGTKISSSSETSIFTANTLNDISFDVGGGTQQFRGKTKELAVFKEALTDAELENLTSWVSFTEMATDLEYTLE